MGFPNTFEAFSFPVVIAFDTQDRSRRFHLVLITSTRNFRNGLICFVLAPFFPLKLVQVMDGGDEILKCASHTETP